MSGNLKISFAGDKEMQANLKRLSIAMKEKILKDAVTEAGKPIVAEAKSLVPTRTDGGESRGLKDLIIMKVKHYRRSEMVMAIIGAEWPAGNAAYPLEKGHKTTLKAGNEGKAFVEPRPFLEPAFDRAKQTLPLSIAATVKRGIEAAIG